ncbi:MAG: GNAT family acetyltransferase, partial [Betaproteobacteria bacterium]
ESDESDLVALWQACVLTRPWNDPRRDIQRKLLIQRQMFLVGEAEGRLVGSVMAGYEGHRGWINYLAVHPDFQRRGYATKLMGAAQNLLLDAGCPKINLQVRVSNKAAVAFYQKLGFSQDEVMSLGKRLIRDWPA